MEETINYKDLAILTDLKKTLEKLDKYLFHLKFTLETKLENFDILENLNVKDEEYVLIQKIENLTIKVGFFWEIGDVYYGVKINIPRKEGKKFIVLKENLLHKKWGFSRNDTNIVISKYNRLVDSLYSFEENDKEQEIIFTNFIAAIDEAKFFVDEIIGLSASNLS